jgi:hypothetical protein
VTKGRHVQRAGQRHGWSAAEVSYYAIWIASLIGEGFIVKGLLWLAHKVAPPIYGMWITMALFAIGLYGISLFYYKITPRDAKLHGFLRWIHTWLNWPGYWTRVGFFLGTMLGSSIGLAEIYKARGYFGNVKVSIAISAALFALVWVPVFILL